MNPPRFAALSTVLCGLLTTTVFAQATTTDRRGDSDKNQPVKKKYAPPTNSGRQVLSTQIAPSAERDLYQLAPGVYVYPAPYSPEYASPRVRPYPDYSDGYRLDRRSRQYRSQPRYYRGRGGEPRYDGRGYNSYRYDNRYGYDYRPYGGYRDAYRQGRYDADHEYLWYIASARAGRLLNQYREMFDEALIMFRDGKYDWAAIKLIGAAERNQASAAARLHAGHCLFALHRYDDAVTMLARAFELSPSLAYKQYDIRDEYGDKDDFANHLEALESHVAARPDDAAALTLLGYITFYTVGPGEAHPFLDRAIRLTPNSYFVPKLLKLARLASGLDEKPRPEKPQLQRHPRPELKAAPKKRKQTGVRPTPPNRSRVRKVNTSATTSRGV